MRFNPPTSWPDVPAGWTPPAGWQPDPAWPKPPAAWPFWLSDDGTPLPVAFAPDAPPWDPRAVAPQYGAAPAGVWPVATPPADPAVAAHSTRRGALVSFGIGVAAFVVGAVSAVLAGRSRSGGWIWTGGMLVGVSLFVRALQQYRPTRGAGPAKRRSVVLVVVGLLVCVGTGVTALVAVISGPPEVPHEAGSCWNSVDGDQIEAVPCTDDHQYKVSDTVDDESQCPMTASYYVELDSGKIGCLADD